MNTNDIRLKTFNSPEGLEEATKAVHDNDAPNTRIIFEDMGIQEYQLKAFLDCLPSQDKRKIKIAVNCYNRWELWFGKQPARRFYTQAVRCSEGCERDRYENIIWAMDDKLFFCYDE